MSLLILLRTKIRTTRGVSCPLAICTATSEMLNTTPMNVIIAELTVVTIVRASAAKVRRSPSSSYAPSSWKYMTIRVSTSDRASHSTTAPTRPAAACEPEGVAQPLPQRGQGAGRSRDAGPVPLLVPRGPVVLPVPLGPLLSPMPLMPLIPGR